MEFDERKLDHDDSEKNLELSKKIHLVDTGCR